MRDLNLSFKHQALEKLEVRGGDILHESVFA